MKTIDLKEAYPYTSNYSESLKTIAFISAFVFVFVFLFRTEHYFPEAETAKRVLYSAYYGVVTFLVAMFNTMIFNFLIKPEDEKNWVVWKEMILYIVHFMTISLAIHFLTRYLMGEDLSLVGILKSIFTTTIVGGIPVSFHILNKQRKLNAEFIELGKEITMKRMAKENGLEGDEISLGQETFPSSDISYFESDKNYVKVVLNGLKSHSIRMTLKNLEDKIRDHEQFLRCHRAYIVNLSNVSKIEGNAQGLKLYLDEGSSYVPVSRSFIPIVRNRL